jgi:hypothetical protein
LSPEQVRPAVDRTLREKPAQAAPWRQPTHKVIEAAPQFAPVATAHALDLLGKVLDARLRSMPMPPSSPGDVGTGPRRLSMRPEL